MLLATQVLQVILGPQEKRALLAMRVLQVLLATQVQLVKRVLLVKRALRGKDFKL